MDQILKRWRAAAERAQDERVRIIDIDGELRATSSSKPLGSYGLARGPEGWECSCVANGMYGLPCKHLWALAEVLSLDVLSDIRIDWGSPPSVTPAA